MPKVKISEYSTTNSSNSDIEGINIAEGCAPSGINNAIRELMVHLKNFQTGASGDPLTVAGTFVASGGVTLSGGATLSGTNTLSGANIISGNINSSGTNTFSGATTFSNARITGGTITGITDLAVADGGTGASSVTANNVILGNGTGALNGNLVAPGTSGNVLTSNGTTWTSAAIPAPTIKYYRTVTLVSGTTYTKPSDVVELYVFVHGATGGSTSSTQNVGRAGIGGPGYSETYYSSPASSYSYSCGAAGSTSGTAGGTTTFGAMSVTGSGGVTGTTGSSGGVGSGGTFNATGGTGGNASYCGGGGGGAGSRAGNGGNGAAGGGLNSSGGGGGGTGGNNASGATAGAAATTTSGSAISLPFGFNTTYYDAGRNGQINDVCSPGIGGSGASASMNLYNAKPGIGYSSNINHWPSGSGSAGFDGFPNGFIGVGVVPSSSAFVSSGTFTKYATFSNGGADGGAYASSTGKQGFIVIVEVYA